MIETDRLILAPPTLADFDDSHAMIGDPGVMAFIGGKAASREEAWAKLLRNIGHWSAFGYGLFTVRERGSGAFVGEVGLARFERGLGPGFDADPEAAWVLAPSAQGRGLATEAVRAAHDWMALRHRPARTVCLIHPGNAASLRVAAKLGYRAFGSAEYRSATPIMLARS